MRPSSPSKVIKILSSFKKYKASGPNSISVRLLQIILPLFFNILSELVNLSFSSGIFPSKLKEAMVIPVFKNKGSQTNTENYRPISLLSNLDKLYQKLMQKQLLDFLEHCNSFYSLQFGFRSNHSTTSVFIN